MKQKKLTSLVLVFVMIVSLLTGMPVIAETASTEYKIVDNSVYTITEELNKTENRGDYALQQGEGVIVDLSKENPNIITTTGTMINFNIPKEDGYLYVTQYVPSIYIDTNAYIADLMACTTGSTLILDTSNITMPDALAVDDDANADAVKVAKEHRSNAALYVSDTALYTTLSYNLSGAGGAKCVAIVYKFHPNNVIWKDYGAYSKNPYFYEPSIMFDSDELRSTYLYAIYGVYATEVTLEAASGGGDSGKPEPPVTPPYSGGVYIPPSEDVLDDSDSSQDDTGLVWSYTDVSETDWYYDSVHYCIENGLMVGVADNKFAPDMTTSRAMIAAILWRMEGAPVVDYNMTFKDVEDDMWYSDAVRWAQSANVVSGYSADAFGPNDPITREQMVAFLWRYCQYKGIDVSVGENTNILSYEDAFDVSEWAMPAMQWACGSGTIGGIAKDGTMYLEPQGDAVRCQSAAMLYRFCTEIMQ